MMGNFPKTGLPRVLACTLLFCLLGSLAAQSGPTQNQISWKAVEGAAAYLVEIRNKLDEILLSQSVEEPRLSFSLEPGEYEVRITSLNKFKKPASRSAWSALSIKRAVDPRPAAVTPAVLYAGAKEQAVTLAGTGFIPQTELSLEGPGGVAKASISAVEDKAIEASFDLSSLRPGEYRIKVSNPRAETAWAGPVTLKPRSQPSISSISKTEFYNDRVSQGIVVEGRDLSADTLAEFKAPDGSVSRAAVEALGPGKISLSWNAGELPAGNWDLVLTNPGGLSASSGPVFSLLDALANPAIARGSTTERIVEKIVEVPVDRIVEKIVEVPVDRIVEVPVDRVVEKIVEVPVDRVVEKIVEVPVDRIVEKIVEVPTAGTGATVEKIVEVPVDRIVEKIVEVPVDRVVEKIVEVPVDRVVEKIVEVPVDRVVEVPVDRIVEVPIEVVVERVVEVPIETEVIVEREVPVKVRVPVGGSGGISLLAGWSPVMGLESFDQIFYPTLGSASLAFQADLGNGFLNTLPLFSFLAFELGANYGEFAGRDPQESILPYLRLADVHGILVARTHFPIALQLSARAGLGATFSWLSKQSPFAAVPTTEFSQDFSLNLGASAMLEFKGGFTLEALFEYVPLFYSSLTFDTLRFSLRTGWRWSSGKAALRLEKPSADPAHGGGESFDPDIEIELVNEQAPPSAETQTLEGVPETVEESDRPAAVGVAKTAPSLGIFLDTQVLGATYWNLGLGLSLFDDIVKLVFSYGQGPLHSTFGGNVLGARIMSNILRLPFNRLFGPRWSVLELDLALGGGAYRFDDTYLGTPQILGAVMGQIEFPRLSFENMRAFSSYSIYTEGSAWFYPTATGGSVTPHFSLGLRVYAL